MLVKRVLILGNDNFPFHRISVFAPFISEIVEEAGFKPSVTQDLNQLEGDRINAYDVLLCYYTRGELTESQLRGLLNFVSSGRGFVGLHSAADSFKDSEEYLDMLGGVFLSHPKHQTFHIEVADRDHPITKGINDFDIYDELYILRHDPTRYHLLLYCLWEGERQPVAWTKGYGEGRVFYLSLGHTKEAYENPAFREILRRGILWASGQL